MNWEALISTMIGLLTALGGWEAVKYLINRKSNKRISESEADSAEFHLYKERLEELRQANAELNKQNLELLKAGARKDDIIEDQKNKIRGLQDARIEDTRKIGRLEKLVMFYKSWHCQREYGRSKVECMRRKPEQNPPLKYEPIENHND